MQYKRILVKLSGESLMGPEGYGINAEVVQGIATELLEISQTGVEIALVLGAGNIFRGMAGVKDGIERATGDYMGMLATVINAMALQNYLELVGAKTRVMSALEIHQLVEPYIRRRATRHLEKGRIVIFAAGTGNPYFTTDTAAALRAAEIQADVILKGTKVDGVYDKDPKIHADAKRYGSLSYMDVLKDRLQVMDSTAISLCMENQIPIVVFDLFQRGNLKKVVSGEKIGTTVT